MSLGSGEVEGVEGCVGRVVGWCWALSGTTPSVSPPRQGQRDSSWVMPKQLLSSIRGAPASCAAADGRDNEAQCLDEEHGRFLRESAGLY